MVPNCYLPSLFLNIQNVCQSRLVTSDSIRHYQPLFPKAHFALLLLILSYLRSYLSNRLGPSQAITWRTTDYIWVENYFKKPFRHSKNFQKQNGIRQSPPLLYIVNVCACVCDYLQIIMYIYMWMYTDHPLYIYICTCEYTDHRVYTHISLYIYTSFYYIYWFCMLHYNNCVILHAITYKFRFTWFEIPLRYIFYSFSKSIDSKKFRNVSRCFIIRCCLLGGHCPAFMALFFIFCRWVSSRVQR
jgi:hypothetical protein